MAGAVVGAVMTVLLRERESTSRLRRGQAWYSQRLYGKALAEFELAVKADPGSAEAHGRVGAALGALGRHEEALVPLGEAIRLDPGHAVAHVDMARSLQGMGRHEEALKAAGEAIRAEPGSAGAHVANGIALASLGRTEEALQSHERAIELDPASTAARNSKGSVLLGQKRYEEAAEEADKAIKADAGSSDAHAIRGRAMRLLGREDEAIRSLRRAVSIVRDNAQAWVDIGELLLRMGGATRSLEAIDTAIRIQPGCARAHHARGMALRRLGRQDEADSAFGRARELDPALVAPVPPANGDDIYVAWSEAKEIRDRIKTPAQLGDLERNQIRSRVAEFLNAARRVLDYHKTQHGSDIVKEYHSLGTRAKGYMQYVNKAKHEYLPDVRIEMTGRRRRVHHSSHTGHPVVIIEEAARLIYGGKECDIDTWPAEMFVGDGIGKGFTYEVQACYVQLEDGEVEIVEFMDAILGCVKELLERHGYDTSGLADASPHYGLA